MNANSTAYTVGRRFTRDRPDRQQSSREGWDAVKSRLRFLADIFGLLSFVAFVVSIALSSIVFARWGLNFLQLASPSDVLMSGLYLVFVFVWPLITGLVIMMYPTAILMNLQDFFRGQPGSTWSRLLAGAHRIVTSKPALAIGYVLMLATAMAIIGVITDELDLEPYIDIRVIASIVVAFAIGAVLLWDKSNRKGRRSSLMSISMSAGFLLLLGHLFIHNQVQVGFQNRPIYLYDSTYCGNGCRMLWIGNQTAVLETLDANLQRTGIIVSRGDEFLRLEPARR